MISKSILKEIILTNQYFITRKTKKIFKRTIDGLPKNINKVVILHGVRRSGKTYILFDFFKQNKNKSLYIDFEDERLIDFNLKDFQALKEVFLELNPSLLNKKINFFLDEVQNIEGWEKFCRRAVERENLNIFVSGSSSKMMPFEIHTELRGRSWSIELLPFSFAEYLNSRGMNLEDKSLIYTAKSLIIKKHFTKYMKWGGFPEVVFVKADADKEKLIKEYMSAMFFRDIVERYNLSNIQLVDALTDKLFSSFSLKFSLNFFYKQYKETFPFSKDSLFRYYGYFIESMLVFEVKKFSESSYKRLRNPAKIYLIDTGLAKRTTSDDFGRLLENIAFLELKRRQNEIFYFQEKNECDFIVKTKNKFLPIQVCYELNDKNFDRETKGLIEACKHTSAKEGIVLTLDEEKDILLEGINIKILPLWKWILEK
ncbi:MAG: ATP-binding protein [Elusimicrobia bacterium]|nr:ATP-binding protein [Elusimicrobiota bacterium]